MRLIKVLKPFKFAHDGIRVEEFEPADQPCPATQELIDALGGEGLFEEFEGDVPPNPRSNFLRFALDGVIQALPAGASVADAEFAIGQLRDLFGDAFTSEDESKVRGLVATEPRAAVQTPEQQAGRVQRQRAPKASRKQLDAALDSLPGEHTDQHKTCAELQAKFGDLFTEADAARVRAAIPLPLPTREQLDAALAELPGHHTDAAYVVDGMRSHFGELFTNADEARVREVVKAAG